MIFIMLHVCISVFLAGISCWCYGYLTPAIAALSLWFATLFGFYINYKWEGDAKPKLKVDGFVSGSIFIVVLLIALRHFMYLFYESENQIKSLNLNNYGDLPLHIGIIKNFALGDTFWPQFTSLAGQKLEYPFGIDFYNALWESIGISTQAHLFFVGLILILLTLAVTNWWLGLLGVVGLFFNGGWHGYDYIFNGIAQDYQGTHAWKNFYNSLLIPQRGFMIGLPIGMFLIKRFYDAFTGKVKLKRLEKIVLGFMWGMLPIFHFHSFFIISIVIAAFAIHSRVYKNYCIKDSPWLLSLLIAVPLGTLWTLPLTGALSKASVIWLQAGWSLNNKSILENIWMNYGPWLLLVLYCSYQVIWGTYRHYRFYFGLGLGLFCLFQFVMMAPWEWDNVKILIWPYLLIVFVAEQILKQFDVKIRSVLYGLLGFSGFVCVISFTHLENKGYGIYEVRELNEAQDTLRTISPSSIFAASTSFNHPLTYFGFKRSVGWAGHLWSHGFKNIGNDRKNMIDKIMQGDSDWKKYSEQLGITHIYWGKHERDEYKLTTQTWRSLKNISQTKDVEIYQLTEK